MVFNKKAISPVVATALLLVVAVVAVVGFQTWFNTYQSGLNVKVEQQSAAGSAITIERLEKAGNNATIYLKNTDTSGINVTSWKISYQGTTLCSATPNTNALGEKVTTFNITDSTCSSTDFAVSNAVDVAVITKGGVYSASTIVR